MPDSLANRFLDVTRLGEGPSRDIPCDCESSNFTKVDFQLLCAAVRAGPLLHAAADAVRLHPGAVQLLQRRVRGHGAALRPAGGLRGQVGRGELPRRHPRRGLQQGPRVLVPAVSTISNLCIPI